MIRGTSQPFIRAVQRVVTRQVRPISALLPKGCSRAVSSSAGTAPIKRAHDVIPMSAPESPEFEHETHLPQVAYDAKRVFVGWGDAPASWSRFHNIWLRDHCRCPHCFHPITKQRLVDTFAISPDIRPLQAESRLDGLEVTWPSSTPHVSFYPWSWLQKNSYDPRPSVLPRASGQDRTDQKILWGSRIQSSPPTVSYDEVMQDEMAVLKWLRKIDQFGFCFVEGVPPNPEDTEKLCKRISYIRETQYGGFWDFTSDLAHGDTAYTSLALKAHTDNTYYTDPSGLQIFHLLSHTEGQGGQTLLVDGFYVASILKELKPSAHDILTRVRVPAHAAGQLSSFYKPGPFTSGYPLLTTDPMTGEVVQVRYNNDDRSVMNGLQGCTDEEWYDALRTWNECLTSSDSEYWLQLTPGTTVVIDNHRVLHGRSSFTGKRRMCGAYIGADEFRSRLSVLEELERWKADGGERSGAPVRSIWDPRL